MGVGFVRGEALVADQAVDDGGGHGPVDERQAHRLGHLRGPDAAARRAVLGQPADGPRAEHWSPRPTGRFREQLLGDDPPAVCRGCSSYRGLF